ncbi:reverse transcriptase domain-containing protein [Tanacetum coccineum]
MLKFLVTGGTVTLRSSRIIPAVDQVTEEKIQVAIHPEYPEQTIAIGSTLTKEGRKKLCELLRQNLDIFTWKPADMTKVSRHIAKHMLNVQEGCFPVRQKKRGQASERNKVICEYVEKLVNASIMKEVHYHSWLSNRVMVKKHDNIWRMCVDFKELNKACPKDGYPLPEIDWKVESLCGYPFKYKGYHQIKMAKEDEEKTAFITSQGIFCYSKMPFGLKNVGTTYQRLVDKAFQKQIVQNLEAYVDDLVIKSCTEQEIIRDVDETFRTLRKINIKLNPKKCTFGMKEGVFLGYKVNSDGLTVCPDKVEAVLSLPSLKCLKDVQRLNEKLASLKRFLSKSAERSLPFFKTLKKCTKKSDFQWTAEAEAAFQQILQSTKNTADLANLGKEAFDDIDTFFSRGRNSKHPSSAAVVPPTRIPQPHQVFHYHQYQPQQAYVVQQQVYHDAPITTMRTERVINSNDAAKMYGGTLYVDYPKRKPARKVGIPEFLNGIGNGVEMYAEKLITEFGDLQNLLVARFMKLKKINIGGDPKVSKHVTFLFVF